MLIELDGVGMTYVSASGPVEALDGITFGVGRGELVALVGPSGCGKSTLLRVVAGLRNVQTGSHAVIAMRRPFGPVRRAVGAELGAARRLRRLLDAPALVVGIDRRVER